MPIQTRSSKNKTANLHVQPAMVKIDPQHLNPSTPGTVRRNTALKDLGSGDDRSIVELYPEVLETRDSDSEYVDSDAEGREEIVSVRGIKRQRASSTECDRKRVKESIKSELTESSDSDSDGGTNQKHVKTTRKLAVPTFRRAHSRRIRPTLTDLPNGTLEKFHSDVMPQIYRIVGSKDAWDPLLDTELLTVWNGVFPDCPLVEASKELRIVECLAKRELQCKMNRRFVDVAKNALKDMWQDFDLKTRNEKKQFVTTMLGVAADPNKKRVKILPFIFQSAYAEGWGNIPKKDRKYEGIFLGPLLLRTFAHYLRHVDTDNCKSHKPKGALVMAIQAVQHTLSFSRDGTIHIPNERKNEFSRKNYKDQEVRKDGRIVVMKKSSLWDEGIKILTDEDWTDIITAASHYLISEKRDDNRDVDVERVEDSGDDDEGDAELLVAHRRGK